MSYSKAEEQTLRDNAPITKDVAEELASQFGKPIRSVISKAVSLKLYKKTERQTVDKTRKADLVRAIEKGLAMRQGELEGLENGRGTALSLLLMNIK
jgi:citrate lyase gamma subunit|tara:strand:+ start:404 stop:694 length:291 start_codon:yes stop_codon:yes gene_type:complete